MSKTNPKHYKRWDYECWEAMEKLFGAEELKSFCKLNSFKYAFRAGNKGGEEALDDIKKAKWYDDKYDELNLQMLSPVQLKIMFGVKEKFDKITKE